MLKSKALLGAGVAVALLLVAGVAVAVTASNESDPAADPDSAARWLGDQLDDGVMSAVYEGKASPDYGLTADVLLALVNLDAEAADRTAILTALEANVDAYIGADTEAYAGATGKLATAVQAAGGDPLAFGDQNLVEKAQARLVTSGDEAGRATDASSFGDFSNTIGQSWVIRGLAGGKASAAELEPVTSYLLRQQCEDGAFRSNMFTVAAPAVEDDPSTDWDDAMPEVLPVDRDCGEITTEGDDELTVDATALGIQALLASQAAGSKDLQDDIDEGVEWLLDQQAEDGSFKNDDIANTNTTGLAAATLRSVGEADAADRAADWIASHQVTDETAEKDTLSAEQGAIAFDQDSLKQGESAGITDATRDQWVRATAQAAVGVLDR